MKFIRHKSIWLFIALLLMGTASDARLIAHYDFSDGDLLDNEVGPEYRLEQRSKAAVLPEVMLNRAYGTAVFSGGLDSVSWLECKGPGRLDEFTFSLWFRTDQVDQRIDYLSVVGSGGKRMRGSWQVHSDTRRQGNLRFRSGESLQLYDLGSAIKKPGIWYHLLVRKKRSGAVECYVTPEKGEMKKPDLQLNDADIALDDIILGSGGIRGTGYRMELANVRIYDTADIPVDSLLDEGPCVFVPEKKPGWNVGEMLSRLKADEDKLLSMLSELPLLQDTQQLDAYGCHSSFLPELDEVPEEPRWTVFLGMEGSRAREIYLIPAADRRDPAMPGYGFPKRFRIMGTDSRGKSFVLSDWYDRDFPDPGRLPVRLIIPHGRYVGIQIDVFKGHSEAGKEFFALDEVFIRGESNLLPIHSVRLSSSFEVPPFWSIEYLQDGKTGMGLPVLPEPDESIRDFVVHFPSKPDKAISLELDLEENRRVGDIIFYPAQPPEGAVVPGYGFPGSIKIEYIRDRGEGVPRTVLREQWVRDMKNPGNNVIRVRQIPNHIRWVRFTLDKLPHYEGDYVLGFGEIAITRDRVSMGTGCAVKSDLDLSETNLLRLTDGFAGGRRVIPVLQWLDGLSLRRDLNLWLKANVALQEKLTARGDQFRRLALNGSLVTLVLILAGISLTGLLLRRRQTFLFRQRVTQDLHDDIGSKIGAISLVSTYLKKATPEPVAQECGNDIDEIAADMKQALRDVLWFTSNRTDRLGELVCKLKEIAESTLPAEMLELKHSPLHQIPDRPIRIKIKRDVMMFFKEALNNAVKHAGASEINISILWNRPRLVIRIQDNGGGFDPEHMDEGKMHLGLEGMKRRAKRIHGDLVIESAPGTGTLVELKMKVK
ncbi:ATP-binding protein [Pontiella agarivorans]|uniref:ATP-binding protein n=1 Tax=Pontiella agarivorans TaxID=3038953 RepID=A0ABU5N1W0_9BACT|nr:ATP-binding protein [Pontiella agarivorans]MDZ8120236.1 ATP-binding protein [Pontiella agarivorans]